MKPQLDMVDPHCVISTLLLRVAIDNVDTAPTATAVAKTAGHTPRGYRVLMNPIHVASASVKMDKRSKGRLRRSLTLALVRIQVAVDTIIETVGIAAVAQRLLSQNCVGITSLNNRMDPNVTKSWTARMLYTRARVSGKKLAPNALTEEQILHLLMKVLRELTVKNESIISFAPF